MADGRLPDNTKVNEKVDTPGLQRWSQRKSAARMSSTGPVDSDGAGLPVSAEPAVSSRDELTDADMPPLETLDEHSDISGFLSPGVSGELRKLALSKLFHLPRFNVTDGMDDYDDNFRHFEALGDIVTADMRHQLEKAAEKLKQAVSHDEQKKPAHGNRLVAGSDEQEVASDKTAAVQADAPRADIPDART